ncbi:PREDICTED: protein BTG3 isoform X2 [Colobus angolensis palliatus]|uniref:protein BTG3 isoform X2 n=1 Tax=Colobus angolensis palliatus TaxID=336983 RepID=UPI0005F4EE51|nr:PREDICTED: protein BTG3 isoform X2 [Colobus angolensis palliatus]
MKNEIAAVVFFFTRLVRKHDKLKKEAVERFAEKLTLILQEKYKNHWYPEKPSKGQAYRCIRVNKFQRVDPDVLKACENSCILYSDLGLPKELTLWVDPCEVCCRYGEKNNAFIVASFENEDENKDEISRKVTRALDKVTSDYHSGSSSSDEETSKEMEVKPSSVTAAASPVYQNLLTYISTSSNVASFAQKKARNVSREWPSESLSSSCSIWLSKSGKEK